MNQAEREYREAMDGLHFSDKEKERIMNNLMNTEKQNKTGRRIPVRAALLAAALCIGCVLSIAAGLPARVYNFMSGGTITTMPGTGQTVMSMDGKETAPIKAEDGRLWFETDGQKLDITDKVDEDTPYIYERTDSATGEKGYVIAGGTVDNFGWVEIALLDDDVVMSGNNYDTVSIAELYEHQENGGGMAIVDSGTHQPWFQAALDQLGLDL